jgi:hypothetical protein
VSTTPSLEQKLGTLRTRWGDDYGQADNLQAAAHAANIVPQKWQSAFGGLNPPDDFETPSNWIVGSGVWNDLANWDDTQTWTDAA